MSNRVAELAELFEQTGHDHHAAFLETDGADAEWPLWYAEYLQDKLAKFFDTTKTKSELVYLLLAADRERSQQASVVKWPLFYAQYFVDHYGA